MAFAIVIPARYGATRFPGKPLALLGNKTILQHVYERACEAGADTVIIATDHKRIASVAASFGAPVAMTDPELPTGTLRVAAAVEAMGLTHKFIINVQGDEPFIEPEAIREVFRLLQEEQAPIATLKTSIKDARWLSDPNKVKVITNKQGAALYFSRAPIPYQRALPVDQWLLHGRYFLHVGLYGFQREVLRQLPALTAAPPAEAESLEQLQWLYHGFSIYVGETSHAAFGIDTPEDLREAEQKLS